MYAGRWYPTVTTLPDGRALIFSGECCDPAPGAPAYRCPDQGNCPPEITDGPVPVPELYDPDMNTLTLLTGLERQQPLYPYMFVLPNGWLVDAGPGESRLLVTAGEPANWAWGDVIQPPNWRPNPPPGARR